jgi:Ca2+-binding RTX toxin-like protein
VTSPSGAGPAAMVTFSAGNTLTFDGFDAAAVQGLPQGPHGVLTATIVMSTNDPIENLLNSTLVDANLIIDPSSITPTSVVANVAVSANFGGLPASVEFIGTGFAVDPVTGDPTGGTVTGFKFSVDGTVRAETSGLNMGLIEFVAAISALHDVSPSTAAFDALFSPYRMDWTGSPDMDLFHYPNNSDVTVRSDYGDVFTTGGGTENGIYGGSGNDTIIATGTDDWAVGGAGHDTFTGNATDNWFRGGAGNDVFDGQGGVDSAVYTNATGSVHANLVTGIVIDGEGGVDQLTNVERIRGGQFDDTFIGNSADNAFRGLDGADTFDGGSGFDEVWYDRDGRQYGGHGSITVDLAAGTAQDGFGATDTLTNIDSVVGSYTDDTLSGDGNDNSLNGDSGNDVLAGRGGNDWYHGGAGYDVIAYSSGADKIDDFKLGVDRLDLSGLGISNSLIQDAFDVAVTATSGADTGVLVDFGGGNTLFFKDLTQAEVRAMDPFVAFIQPSGSITSHVAGADLSTQLALTALDQNATKVFDANGITITGSNGDSIRIEIEGFDFYEELTGAYDFRLIYGGSISSMTLKDSSGVDLMTISGGEVDAFEMVNALELDALATAPTGIVSLTNTFSIFSQFAIDWTGSSGADLIGGFDFNDTLRGGAGSDYIETNGGDDIIEGGAGIDFVVLGTITSIDPATGFVTFDSTNDGSNTIRIGLDGTDADLDAILGFDVTAVGAAGGDVIQLMLPSVAAGTITVGFTQITVSDLQEDFAIVQGEIAAALAGIDPEDLIDDTVEVLLVADATSTAVIELDMSSGSAVVTTHAILEGVTDFPALSDDSHIIVTNPVV